MKGGKNLNDVDVTDAMSDEDFKTFLNLARLVYNCVLQKNPNVLHPEITDYI